MSTSAGNHVYISFDPADTQWQQTIQSGLEELTWPKTDGQIVLHSPTNVGERPAAQLEAAIDKCIVAILLLSPAYLESALIRNKELPHLLRRNRNFGMTIVPVPVAPCAWEETELAEFVGKSTKEQPLSSMTQAQVAAAVSELMGEISNLYREQDTKENGRIRIVVADDHEHAVRGIRDILEDHEDMVVVGLCRTRQEVEQKVQELQPDIVLLDLAWYRDDTVGLELIGVIHELSPSSKIIPISNYPELVERAKRMGTMPLEKNFTYHELIRHVHYVYRAEDNQEQYLAMVAKLSSRELDVLRLIAHGDADKEIGTALNISESTVKKHVRSIRETLNARSRVDAAVIATKAGIL